jgi:Mn-dependent DtxR family transcriptional regulator
VWVGISHTTGSYLQNIRDLAKDGYLERGSGDVWLTGSGIRAAVQFRQPDSSRDLQQRWYSRLPGSMAKALELVVNHYPLALEKDELARKMQVSPTTGSFLQNLRDLRGYGLLDFKSGAVRATSMIGG